LALIEIGAISVAFTDDFRNEIFDDLFERYNLQLFLTTRANAKLFPNMAAHVGLMMETRKISASWIGPHANVQNDESDQLTWAVSSGSSGGLKGLVISRKGVMATCRQVLESVGPDQRDRLLLFLPPVQLPAALSVLWRPDARFRHRPHDYTQLFAAIEKLHPTILPRAAGASTRWSMPSI
jgi:acyl-coenzyme A synthetase/AMP-(fatty) acid ligase